MLVLHRPDPIGLRHVAVGRYGVLVHVVNDGEATVLLVIALISKDQTIGVSLLETAAGYVMLATVIG